MLARSRCGAAVSSLRTARAGGQGEGRARVTALGKGKEKGKGKENEKGLRSLVLLFTPLCPVRAEPWGQQGREGRGAAEGKDFEPNPFPFKSGSKSSALQLVAGARVLVGFWKLGAGAFVNLPRAVPAQDKLQRQLCSLLRVAGSSGWLVWPWHVCSRCRYPSHSCAVSIQPGAG